METVAYNKLPLIPPVFWSNVYKCGGDCILQTSILHPPSVFKKGFKYIVSYFQTNSTPLTSIHGRLYLDLAFLNAYNVYLFNEECRHITSHHVSSRHISSHHVSLRHISSHHVTSCHIMSHHVTSRHITS